MPYIDNPPTNLIAADEKTKWFRIPANEMQFTSTTVGSSPFNSPEQRTLSGPAEQPASPATEPSRRQVANTGLLGETYSPELEAFRKQLLQTNWFAESPYAKYLQDVMAGIQGIKAPTGMTEAEKALQLNQLRANILGQTKGLMRQATEQLGLRGLTGGESGLAGAALADIMRGGQQQFAEAASNLAVDEARRRFQEQLAAGQFELGKLSTLGDIANRFEQWRQSNIGLGFQAGSLAAQMEQFAQQLAEQRAQRAAQAAMAGDQLAFQRERFNYEKEMDALKLLMGLYSQETGAQEAAYQPYWQAWLKY